MKKAMNLISVLGFLGFAIYICSQMVSFGSPIYGIGDEIFKLSLDKTKALNSVSSIVFDFRGYDTLGESIVLFTAVAGVIAVLRNVKKGQTSAQDKMGIVLETMVNLILPITFVLGAYIILHGHLTPGGGFQGGVVLAAGIALIFFAYGRNEACKKYIPHHVNKLESFGAVFFLALAFVGIYKSDWFFSNVLSHGTAGNLFSSGTIFLMNIAVGLKVFAGMALIILLFVKLHDAKDGREE